MEESTSREKILKAVRNALIEPSENPFSIVDMDSAIFEERDEIPELIFADEFTKVGGVFVYCENNEDFGVNFKTLSEQKQWNEVFCFEGSIQNMLDKLGISYQTSKEDLARIQVGITPCEYLIARTGSIMVSSRCQTGRRLNVLPETHIVIAKSNQIVSDIKDAFRQIKLDNEVLPSMISLITGASRTADIEKTLVMGAHGPRELYVFFIDEYQD